MPTKSDKHTITIHRTHYTNRELFGTTDTGHDTACLDLSPEDSLILIGSLYSLNCSHWSVMVDAYSTNSEEYVNMYPPYFSSFQNM